jgi:hypothetical protein
MRFVSVFPCRFGERASVKGLSNCFKKSVVDGIYPLHSRFVRGIKVPATREEKNYTSWQEGASKDVERAFDLTTSSTTGLNFGNCWRTSTQWEKANAWPSASL